MKGYRNQLKGEINACVNGAEVTLPLKTAEKLLEIVDQCIHLNENFEQPGEALDD